MSELSQNASNAVDSWEDFGEDEDVMQRLNEAIQKAQISAPKHDIDPFGKPKKETKDEKDSDDRILDGYHHLAVLRGESINTEEVINVLTKEFGNNVRLKQIDDSNVIIIFANVIDARHAVRNGQKLLPSKIYALDDPQFQHIDFVLNNRDSLLPAKSSVRPATNMSLIRNVVSRHLNVKSPPTSKQKEEKEKLQKAREAKKTKDSYWK